MLAKLFALTALLVVGEAFMLNSGCSLGAHDFIACPAANANDPVLARFDVSMPWTLIPMSVNIVYPPAGTSPAPTATITCIRITDKLRNGFNGFPVVAAGGVGQTSATIVLNQCLYGIDFKVEILGQ